MNDFFIKKINKVTISSYRLYLDFFGIKDVQFQSNSELVERLISIHTEAVSIMKNNRPGKLLIVTDEWMRASNNKEFKSIYQLLYELEVFSSIPAEIYDCINKEKFKSYCNKTFCDLQKRGWKLCVSNDGIQSDLLPVTDCFIESFGGADTLPQYSKMIIINCGDNNATTNFYQKYKMFYHIETHRFIALFREYIIDVIYHYFKQELNKKNVSLHIVNWRWANDNCLYPKKKICSEDIEKQHNYSIMNIIGREEQYTSFLKDIYREDYSEEYVKNVMDIPQIGYYGPGCVRHVDKNSEFLNVSCFVRKTASVVESSCRKIYLLGGCVFFGYAIDDANTVASHLQKVLDSAVKERVNVVNYATWGGNIDETWMTLYDLKYNPGDIVVISYAGLIPVGDDYNLNDISVALQTVPASKFPFYFDKIHHCNKVGYKMIANKLFEIIEKSFETYNYENYPFSLKLISNHSCLEDNFVYQKELDLYYNSVKHMLPPLHKEGKIYGSIVMNCNPFTLGHRALVEYASSKVDYLIVFVVQEDKSFFPFEARLDLVRAGTSDLKNVFVIPSGKLMISAITFPGYFVKENPDSISIDSTADVEIFARYIAPLFGITVRFLGEEPTDTVTNNYNATIKTILPMFGVDVKVIPRVTINNGTVISATYVRKYIKEKKLDEIRSFVPETTFKYIEETFG